MSDLTHGEKEVKIANPAGNGYFHLLFTSISKSETYVSLLFSTCLQVTCESISNLFHQFWPYLMYCLIMHYSKNLCFVILQLCCTWPTKVCPPLPPEFLQHVKSSILQQLYPQMSLVLKARYALLKSKHLHFTFKRWEGGEKGGEKGLRISTTDLPGSEMRTKKSLL